MLRQVALAMMQQQQQQGSAAPMPPPILTAGSTPGQYTAYNSSAATNPATNPTAQLIPALANAPLVSFYLLSLM